MKEKMNNITELVFILDRSGSMAGLETDTIGAIHHIGNVHKYARPEDVPAHTMFIITTDDQENASHKYTSDRVKHMIEADKNSALSSARLDPDELEDMDYSERREALEEAGLDPDDYE